MDVSCVLFGQSKLSQILSELWQRKTQIEIMRCSCFACFLFSSFLLLFVTPIYSSGVNEERFDFFFKNITREEKDILEEFFKELITKHHFGYVLFGNKPMATCGIAEHVDILYLFSEDALKNQKLQKGWQTWQARHHFLESDHFVLRLTKNPLCPAMRMLVLINRQLCLNCIKDHIQEFRQLLSEQIQPEEILTNLETKESILQEVLKNHEDLFGILLGYGTHNSSLYVKTKPYSYSFFSCSKEEPPLSSFFQLSKWSGNRLTPFNTYDSNLLLIDLPRFAEDAQAPESINLRTTYFKTWEKLNDIFLKENILEVMLARWFGCK